jgi:hypothetical protein
MSLLSTTAARRAVARAQKFLVEHISYSLLFVRQLSKRPQVNI